MILSNKLIPDLQLLGVYDYDLTLYNLFLLFAFSVFIKYLRALFQMTSMASFFNVIFLLFFKPSKIILAICIMFLSYVCFYYKFSS